MPLNELLQFQKTAAPMTRMALQLAIHCAPIIKGGKLANMMTVKRDEFQWISEVLKGTPISYRFLSQNGEYAILYLYRKKWLAGYVQSRQVAEFLQEYGYQNIGIEDMLDHLSERIRMYRDGQVQFPHEIGMFLGYPLSDVKGFLQDDGKQYAYLGYWKVYDNINSKIRLFRSYDEMRETAVCEVMNGKTIRELAVGCP